MSTTQNNAIMKLITTDKVAHGYEMFKGISGSWMVNASLDKSGPAWSWYARVWYTHTDGIQYEQGVFCGNEYSKLKSRQELERVIAEELSKPPCVS